MTEKNPTKLEEIFQCPLCGYTFSQREAAACGACPFRKRCGLTMCPRCGHEYLMDAK